MTISTVRALPTRTSLALLIRIACACAALGGSIFAVYQWAETISLSDDDV